MASTTTTASPSYSSDWIYLEGYKCRLHKWNSDSSAENKSGVCIVYHGFLAHGLYPTVRYAAELLATNGYVVVAADLPGHGESQGTPGYLPSAKLVQQCGIQLADKVIQEYKDMPLFLVGSSMGGTCALAVAAERSTVVAGIALLAPMLALKVSPLERHALKSISYIVPKMRLIPSSATSPEKQYRDPEKRKECVEDEYTHEGNLYVASASTCVELANQSTDYAQQLQCPVLCMVATEDVVVHNKGAYDFMETTSAKDKTLKEYKALHGLLCEPSPLLDEIQGDILKWTQDHTTSAK